METRSHPCGFPCKSVRKLAKELSQRGHQVSHQLVSELLHELGYSLQANRKTREGGDHPDRDAQFEYVNAQAESFLAAGEPVVSVDAKKKELVGDFKNPGREWGPQGEPEQVRVYDFPISGLGRATPYGVYDLGQNAGWGSAGDGSRYRRLRGRKHSALVERGWTVSVSWSQAATHQRRWRRKQWLSRALVEMGTATVGR